MKKRLDCPLVKGEFSDMFKLDPVTLQTKTLESTIPREVRSEGAGIKVWKPKAHKNQKTNNAMNLTDACSCHISPQNVKKIVRILRGQFVWICTKWIIQKRFSLKNMNETSPLTPHLTPTWKGQKQIVQKRTKLVVQINTNYPPRKIHMNCYKIALNVKEH